MGYGSIVEMQAAGHEKYWNIHKAGFEEWENWFSKHYDIDVASIALQSLKSRFYFLFGCIVSVYDLILGIIMIEHLP